jgi:uncharacterized phiE125 gp8 family phage protein
MHETYGLVETAAPATEPVTRAEAKLHCRIDSDLTADDALVDRLIAAARRYCEERCARSFVTRTYRLSFPSFPWLAPPGTSWRGAAGGVRLPRGPVISLSSVKYRDPDGVLQTLATTEYTLDADSGVLQPAAYTAWPATQAWRSDGVQVVYSAGCGAASAVPESLKQAVLLLVGFWYEGREAVAAGVGGVGNKALDFSVDALLGVCWDGRY